MLDVKRRPLSASESGSESGNLKWTQHSLLVVRAPRAAQEALPR